VTPLPRFTLRKITILLHLEAGQNYKQIAGDLDIHIDTVRVHVQEMADALPGTGAPKDKVMLWCERLLVSHADIVANIKRAA
jgi:FixJ family two-component response regulator